MTGDELWFVEIIGNRIDGYTAELYNDGKWVRRDEKIHGSVRSARRAGKRMLRRERERHGWQYHEVIR